jgi:6,7-dimethyl-8-ribityllumazine synthase
MAKPRRGARTGEGGLQKVRMLIVESRFYDDISGELLKGATRVLEAAGVAHDRVTVPGSLEIPAAIAIAVDAAQRKRRPYDGVVALGCVIRGDTIHFEIVSQLSARGLMELSVARKLPIGNGILTVDTDSQAMARAKMDEGDKGGDAARAALAMVRLKRSLG